MRRVATVILNWNGRADTMECLSSIARVEHPGWEHLVIVADNASSDGTPDAVREAYPDVVLLDNGGNLGFAEGNNRAIEWARSVGIDYVILLNNDTVVEPDTLRLLVGFADRHPAAGAVMPLIEYYGREGVWYAGGGWLHFGRMEPLTEAPSAEPYRTQLFTGCCVLLPMRVLDEVGDLDPDLYMYFEDTDLALRMEEAGYETWVVPAAVVKHKVGSSSGGAVSAFAVYYQTRNNLIMIHRRMKTTRRRAVGYSYMVAVSAKMYLNLVTRPVPRKRAVARAIAQAWGDFLRGKVGPRLQRIG